MQLLVSDGAHQRLIGAALSVNAQSRPPDPADQRLEPRIGTQVAHSVF
jgi:hypothetical protein